MPISRKHVFLPNDPILVDELLLELDQLYSLLNGALKERISIFGNSVHTNLLVHNSSGPSIEFQKGGVVRARIGANQQLYLATQTEAPIVVVSTTKVVGLNAEKLDDKLLSAFILNNIKHVETYLDFYFELPSGGPIATTNKTVEIIIPAVTNASLKHVTFRADRIDDSSECTLNLKKNGVSITTGLLTNALSGQDSIDSQNINTAVVENDVISLIVDNVVNNTAGVFNVSARVRLIQDLI